VGGSAEEKPGTSCFPSCNTNIAVVNLNEDGSLNTTFGGDGVITGFTPSTLADVAQTYSNGYYDLIAMGSAGSDMGLIRVDHQGNLVSSLGTGGIQNYLGTTQLNKASVIDNNMTSGTGVGGGLQNSLGQLTVVDSTVRGNRSGGGGAISNYGGSLSVTGATLLGNIATIMGGGVKNENGNAYLTNVTLNNNRALGGGGFYNYNATACLTNVTLSGNSATNPGGGVSNPSYGTPHLHMINMIVVGSPAGNNCYFGSAPTPRFSTYHQITHAILARGVTTWTSNRLNPVYVLVIKIKCPTKGTDDFVSFPYMGVLRCYPLYIGVPNRIRTGDVRSTVGSFATKL
jgi:hypothetical protein